METLRYQEYEGSIEVSVEGRCLHGKLLFVDDLITYEGKDVDSLDTAFREAVEDYLKFCNEVGKSPEKPCKGLFNVRVKPETHRAAVVRAYHDQQTLNELVCTALESYLSGAPVRHSHHHVHEHVLKKNPTRVRWSSEFTQPFDTSIAWTVLSDPSDVANHTEELDSWTQLPTANSVRC